MAGHSHWANIAHKKALIDNKRGKLWSKLAKAIIIAAKAGGGDPDAESAPPLRDHRRQSRQHAQGHDRPRHQEGHRRARRRATSRKCSTKATARAASPCCATSSPTIATAPPREVRKIFEIAGGKLGGAGCVAWMFDRKGLLAIPASQTDEEALMELALEAGADDVRHVGDNFEITCDPDVYTTVCDAIDKAGLTTEAPRDHAHPQGHRSTSTPTRPAAC